MTRTFDILQLGDPRLRQPAAPVGNVPDVAFQQELDDLLDFVLSVGGMGIAAPQVGIGQQYFILSSHPNERYPHAPSLVPTVVINPDILWYSDTLSKDWEGCLSLPGLRGLVARHTRIGVRYVDRDNCPVETVLDGFLARVFQHEFDHLQGRVFLDRVESTDDVMMEQEWRRRHLDKQRRH